MNFIFAILRAEALSLLIMCLISIVLLCCMIMVVKKRDVVSACLISAIILLYFLYLTLHFSVFSPLLCTLYKY